MTLDAGLRLEAAAGRAPSVRELAARAATNNTIPEHGHEPGKVIR
jgi:hypothetical protein